MALLVAANCRLASNDAACARDKLTDLGSRFSLLFCFKTHNDKVLLTVMDGRQVVIMMRMMIINSATAAADTSSLPLLDVLQ